MGGSTRHPRGDRGAVQHTPRPGPHLSLPGAIPSPNIWRSPEIYEIENRAFDRAGLVEAAIAELVDYRGRDVLDIGCGSGFHLPRLAEQAGRVYGVEPHPGLVALAQRRTRSLGAVQVLAGTAQQLPLPPSSIDFAHARWAYFFGPGCEPGLAELARVMRRGGLAVLIDNDLDQGEFAHWFRRGYPRVGSPVEFFTRMGFHRRQVLTSWTCDSRADFEAIVQIEFDPSTAQALLTEVPGTTLSYGVNVWWRRY